MHNDMHNDIHSDMHIYSIKTYFITYLITCIAQRDIHAAKFHYYFLSIITATDCIYVIRNGS